MLKNTGLAGQPDEYFWIDYEAMWSRQWGTSTYAEYLSETVKRTTTPNGVFGAKLMWAYLDGFLGRVRQVPAYANMPTPALLSSLFPNLIFFRMTRQHKVRQAVSLWKAVQTQIWMKPIGSAPVAVKQAVYDFQSINYWLEMIHEQEAGWQNFFDTYGITPFTITYENFTLSYEKTILEILCHLGVSIPVELGLNSPSLIRQADEQSEEWVLRFMKEKAAL